MDLGIKIQIDEKKTRYSFPNDSGPKKLIDHLSTCMYNKKTYRYVKNHNEGSFNFINYFNFSRQ